MLLPVKSINDKIIVDKSEDSDAFLCVFKGERDALIFAWLQTVNYVKRTDDTTGNVKDTRTEKIKIELPFELAGKTTVFNELGDKLENGIVNVEGDKTTLDELILKGGEIVIVEIKK